VCGIVKSFYCSNRICNCLLEAGASNGVIPIVLVKPSNEPCVNS